MKKEHMKKIKEKQYQELRTLFGEILTGYIEPNGNLENFKCWIKDLPLQTLTDELKDTILNRLELVLDEVFENGIKSTKRDIIEFIETRM